MASFELMPGSGSINLSFYNIFLYYNFMERELVV